MMAFVFVAGALTLAVVALLTLPLLRAGGAGVDRATLNARLLKEDFEALEREKAAGTLGVDAYARAHDELTRRLLEDARPTGTVATATRPLPTMVGIALAVPICGALLYVLMGTPAALSTAAARQDGTPQAAQAQAAAPADVQSMVTGLAAKLAAHPDDPKGWAMLGRSYSVLGRFSDAVAAFGRIGPQLRTNAGWLAEYADALAMTANGDPSGRPDELARQALQIDPGNTLALMLAGYAATRRGDDAAALPLLERAQRQVAPGSGDDAFLQQLIAHAKGGAGQGTAAGDAGTQVSVNVATALRDNTQGRTLFVIARAPGRAMPIAVIRRMDPTLPARVSLRDADSLDPSHPLSQVPRVEIEARLTVGGDAMPKAGDLYGIAEGPVGHPLRIRIDRRRP